MFAGFPSCPMAMGAWQKGFLPPSTAVCGTRHERPAVAASGTTKCCGICACACVCLQVIAFCLYSAPLYYMAEKLLGVHTKPMHLRLLARLPVCECTRKQWQLGLAASTPNPLLSG